MSSLWTEQDQELERLTKRPRKVVAYQLSLLGDEPKPGLAYSPGVCQWVWFGGRFPLSHDAVRQNIALRADSREGQQ